MSRRSSGRNRRQFLFSPEFPLGQEFLFSPNRIDLSDSLLISSKATPPGAPSCQLDVICEGDPFAMGLAQGQSCRAKLALMDPFLPQLEGLRLARPRWLPYRLFLRFCEGRATRLVRKPLLRDDRDSHTRLEGISRGSGVRLRLLYLINALECLMASPRRCTVNPPLGACSAVAVRGSRSGTGGACSLSTRCGKAGPLGDTDRSISRWRPWLARSTASTSAVCASPTITALRSTTRKARVRRSQPRSRLRSSAVPR